MLMCMVDINGLWSGSYGIFDISDFAIDHPIKSIDPLQRCP